MPKEIDADSGDREFTKKIKTGDILTHDLI